MEKKAGIINIYFITSLLIVFIFILAGFVYFNSKNISEVKGTYTVTYDNLPIEFDLPKNYGVYLSSFFEGANQFNINIGKELKNHFLNESAPLISMQDFVPQNGNMGKYKPSEYIDIIFSNANPEINRPKFIKLFSNKAVQTYSDADNGPVIVGFLRGDQLPENFHGKEYLVTIDGTTYGTGKEFNQELFDLVVNSLRIKSK